MMSVADFDASRIRGFFVCIVILVVWACCRRWQVGGGFRHLRHRGTWAQWSFLAMRELDTKIAL